MRVTVEVQIESEKSVGFGTVQTEDRIIKTTFLINPEAVMYLRESTNDPECSVLFFHNGEKMMVQEGFESVSQKFEKIWYKNKD